MSRSIFYQLKKASTTTSAEYVNVGGVVEVEMAETAKMTALKRAIKEDTQSYLGGVDVVDIQL